MGRNVYFITGVTGDLGGELLRQLAKSSENEIYCLIRSRDTVMHDQRLSIVLEENNIPTHGNIFSIEGDVCEKKMNMSNDVYQGLTKRVHHVIHCAADVRFNQPIDAIRKTNVEGTRNMLDFAAQCHGNNPSFVQFNYISTAYVAGKRKGVIYENELSDKSGFNNSYEQSKYEAELLTNQYKETGLPVIIFRPSIILGASHDGRVKKGSVLYPMIKLYVKVLPSLCLPVANKTAMDVVPLDFVGRAITFICSDKNNNNQCYHLALGKGRTIFETQLLKIMVEELEIDDVRFVPNFFWMYIVVPFSKIFNPALYKRIKKLKVMGNLAGYRSYFRGGSPHFAVDCTRRVLEGSGITIPDGEAVFRSCVRYVKQNYLND